MERKIGEIFELDGEWYQCIENDSCGECSFFTTECGSGTKSDLADKVAGLCSKVRRIDSKHAIFKKLEKVGEPYMLVDKKFQKYKVFKTPYIYHKVDCSWQSFADPYYISLEIKQTKEDMEEKDIKPYDKIFSEGTVSNTENLVTSSLKPFDLEAAKSGKPVCTRDGRKARIICFDAKDTQPIIGLYEKNIDGIVREYLCSYHTDGRMYDDQDTGYDLMMLPEKKEGWINVYNSLGVITFSHNPFDSKEEALAAEVESPNKYYVDTIKISWEE